MNEKIKIIKGKGNFEVKLGDRTLDLLNRLTKLKKEEKDTLLAESSKILSNCVSPINTVDNVTGLAVGYVQSGKTMSFTTLSTLAIDNGFRVIIYFAGIKNNLLRQTVKRLRKDLEIAKNRKHFKLYENPNCDENINAISNAFKLRSKPAILIPILKKSEHIIELSKLFSSNEIKSILGNNGVLIIDDEADQASLNTFARKNSKSKDWEENKISSTYSSILKLKASLPNHSYIQYTATPQGPLLINLVDLLSPEFHVVLTPGKEYTGGKVFFEDNPNLIVTIPQKEVYHHKKNNLNECPPSLINALQVYLIGIAIQVNILENENFLSMMVHADRENDASRKFFSWVSNIITSWGDILSLSDSDPSKVELITSFKKNFKEAISEFENPPNFDEVMPEVLETILDTNVQLVIKGSTFGTQEEDWSKASSHILIGAEMLNRGFTVEGLSVTYMPRNTVSKSNADTIQQRCRFFGYKRSYLESCRVYLPVDSILEYKEYVDHEEILRAKLKTTTLRDLHQTMVLGNMLNPTRNNILSAEIIRQKLSGWRQINALYHITENINYIENFISNNKFDDCKNYKTKNRNHKIVKLPIYEVIEFLKSFKVIGMADTLRKSSTIQYLCLLKEKEKIDHAYIYLMAHEVVDGRERELKEINNHLRINNIFMGPSNDSGLTYPGDKAIKKEDSLCIQIHKIRLNHSSVKWKHEKLYTLGIYYPEIVSHTLIGVSN